MSQTILSLPDRWTCVPIILAVDPTPNYVMMMKKKDRG